MTFKVAVKIVNEMANVESAAQKAAFRNIFHAAASLRKDVYGKIERSDVPSSPGSPPHTRRGHLRRALRFDVDQKELIAVIGPRASIVGTSGAAHEFGGQYKSTSYPQRPFMGPGLDRASSRFADDWRGSIGQ